MSETQADTEETERLLQRAAAGDAQAVEELFARHQPFLRQLVELRLDARLRARVDPSDVVQEAHLEALRRLEVFLEKRPMAFRLWLRQIACDQSLKARRHHIGTARRSLAREAILPEQSSLVFAARLMARTASPSRSLERRDLQRRLHAAIAKLSEADYELILMRHFEGLSNQEAAVVLGTDPATASKRHGRALLRLHKILFEDGMTESKL
jgi:RNA polymerase sigma-70 factor (ECF subfamily)